MGEKLKQWFSGSPFLKQANQYPQLQISNRLMKSK